MTTETRPNILWYCTDQQRYDTIGALGNPHVHTKAVDALVARGVAFTHAYTQNPICTPSRASFLTGMYPSTVRANGNGIAYMPEDYPLVTKLLADSGYDCGLVGKLHLASAEAGVEPRAEDGYRYFAYSHAPRDDWDEGHAYVDWLKERGQDLKTLQASDDNVPAEYHQTTWATDACIEFLDQSRNGPWLLSVNPYYPHPPFDPPREYFERFDPDALPGPLFRESDLEIQCKLADSGVDFQNYPSTPEKMNVNVIQAQYYAMIELIDDQFQRLLDAMEERGELANTLVIFTSDHGESLGDHGLVEKGCRFMEGMVRVPLVFALPGTVAADRRSDALVELTDIAPTLLEIAGLTVPESMHGISLLPILTDDDPPEHHRDYVRSEYRAAIADFGDDTFASMICDGRWKLNVYHGHGLGELYDLVNDPDEFTNLWDDAAHRDRKLDLLLKVLDDTVFATDWGPDRVGWI